VKQYLSAAEIARLLSIDKSTVTKWVWAGKFENVHRIGDHGKYRIPLESVNKFLETNQKKV
jgi:excisionase family DNA binding protein